MILRKFLYLRFYLIRPRVNKDFQNSFFAFKVRFPENRVVLKRSKNMEPVELLLVLS